jgi:hypothetical protein
MTYIATFIAAWTFLMTRNDAKPTRIHSHKSSSDANISSRTLQLAATVWLRAGKERQPKTILHRLPFHMPEPAVVVTIAQVENHLRSYGIMPQTHLQITPNTSI